MKKLGKILTLILVFVCMVTAITVVALADEPANLKPITRGTQDFESFAKNQTYSNSASKDGKWVVMEADDGNKYVLAMPEDVAGTNTQENIDPSTGRGANAEHIELYPTMAFDFDIKSTSGGYSSVSLRPDMYGTLSASYRLCMGNSVYLSYLSASLNKVDEWQHVTAIFRHVGNGLIKVYFYVDGVESTYATEIDFGAKTFSSSVGTNANILNEGITKWSNLVDENGAYKYNNVGISIVSLYACAEGRNIGYDNFKFTFYPESYDNDAIASYIYNDDYKMPFGVAEAKVNDTAYEDFDEAFAALNDGDRLTIKTDLDGVTIINKAVTVDVNKYDDDGNATGEYYKATIKSNGGYIVTYDAGIYTLTKSEKNVEVRFDAPCGEENCTCYAGGVGHKRTDTAIVPMGVIPEYIGSTAIDDMDGVVAEFVGWSYEKGGKAADLTAITEAQVEAGVLNLYPVYNVVKYDFGYIAPDGTESYYFAKSFEAVAQAALKEKGSKIILYSDVEFYNKLIVYSDSNCTIDLNGHALTKIFVDGSVKKLDTATGEYVQTATTTEKQAFYANGDASATAQGYRFTLNVTSSKPGAQMRGLKASGTVYYDANGDFVKRELSSVTGGAAFMYGYLVSKANLNISNVDIYMVNIFDGAHGGSSLTLNITNTNFYRTGGGTLTDEGYGYDCFYFGGNATVNVKDSLFYFPSSSIFKNNVRLLRAIGGTVNIVFENCDIISDNSSVQSRLENDNHHLTYKNCRVYNITNEQNAYKPVFDGRVIATNTISSKVNLAEDRILADKSQSITYSLPTAHRVTLDANGNPVFNFAFADRAIAFTKICDLEKNIFTTVTWLDADGTVIKQAKEFKNEIVTAPAMKIPSGDGFRAFTNPDWLDANGNKVSLLLGDLDSYTFKLSTALPENPQYVGQITDILFSLTYYGHFAYNLYAPDVEGVTYIQIGDYKVANIYSAVVDGVKYKYANAGWIGPANALKEYTKYIIYEIDGVQYSVSVNINAMLYAELLCMDPYTADVEKDAILKMLDFVEEAYRASGTLDDATKQKLDNFFNTYNNGNRPEAVTTYPESEVHTIDNSVYTYVDSIQYGIYSGNSRYCVMVTLKKEYADLKYSVTVGGMTASTKTKDDGTVVYYTNNNSLAGALMLANSAITIYDENKTEVAKTDYSLATYINGVKAQGGDASLPEALYSFGKAVKAVRAYLATK